MQDRHLFEYAVIRVVPRVEREEFLNIGIVLFCAKQKFLQMKYVLDEARLQAFSNKIDIEELKEHLHSFERICACGQSGGAGARGGGAARGRGRAAARGAGLQ